MAAKFAALLRKKGKPVPAKLAAAEAKQLGKAQPKEGGPVITDLSSLPADSPLWKRKAKGAAPDWRMATILGEGGTKKLG